jgi:MFS family permease
LSSFFDNFGDGMRLAAFPLLAVHVTHSPAAIATVTAVQGLPWLLGPAIGALVDRTDRRRLMVAADAARGVMVAVLAAAALVHAAGLPLIYLTAAVSGIGSAVRGTASVACVPRLVDSEGLDRANGQIVAGGIVGGSLAGPAAGGWLFGLAAALPFAASAGAIGVAILLLLTLPDVFRPLRQPGAVVTSARWNLTAGLAWVRRDREIRNLALALGVISAMDAAWFAVLVLYVTRLLHQAPGTYGVLLTVGSVGGIAAGAGGARLTRRVGPWGSVLVAGLAMAGSQFVLGLTGNVFVAAAMLAASSAAFALFNMTAATMRQRRVPDELQGRVSGLFGAIAGGTEALGAVAGGVIASAAGIRTAVLVGAAPIALVVLWAAWWRRPEQPGPADGGEPAGSVDSELAVRR